jgi:hypothetical protein
MGVFRRGSAYFFLEKLIPKILLNFPNPCQLHSSVPGRMILFAFSIYLPSNSWAQSTLPLTFTTSGSQWRVQVSPGFHHGLFLFALLLPKVAPSHFNATTSLERTSLILFVKNVPQSLSSITHLYLLWVICNYTIISLFSCALVATASLESH